MILYFSETGSSEYTAKRTGEEINDGIVNLREKIRNRDFSGMHSDTPWVVAVPTCAWRIPCILQEQLEKTELTGNKNIYFVMACDENVGDAGRYLKKLTDAKGLSYQGCAQITMLENYVTMLTTPTREKTAGITRRSQSTVDRAVRQIKLNRPFPQVPVTRGGKISSEVVNDIFHPMFIHAKKFRVTGTCISCGKCASNYPLNNIRLENGSPVWSRGCTHCMACINRYPNQAIEYGKHTQNLPHYTCS